MLWKIFQFVVIVAVAGSNGQYHWTPNGYVAGLVAVFAAFAATALLSELFRLISWLFKLAVRPDVKSLRLPGSFHQGHVKSPPPGRLGTKRFR